MVVIDSFTSKNGDRRVLEDIETIFAGVQSKSFDAHTKVAAEEIFYVAAAAPGVIATNVSVVGAKHRVAFTGTLNHIYQPKVGIVLGVGERIGAKAIHVPFVVAVPLGTRRQRDLLHFFSRVLSRMALRNIVVVTEPPGLARFGFGAFVAVGAGKAHEHAYHRCLVGPTD